MPTEWGGDEADQNTDEIQPTKCSSGRLWRFNWLVITEYKGQMKQASQYSTAVNGPEVNGREVNSPDPYANSIQIRHFLQHVIKSTSY